MAWWDSFVSGEEIGDKRYIRMNNCSRGYVWGSLKKCSLLSDPQESNQVAFFHFEPNEASPSDIDPYSVRETELVLQHLSFHFILSSPVLRYFLSLFFLLSFSSWGISLFLCSFFLFSLHFSPLPRSIFFSFSFIPLPPVLTLWTSFMYFLIPRSRNVKLLFSIYRNALRVLQLVSLLTYLSSSSFFFSFFFLVFLVSLDSLDLVRPSLQIFSGYSHENEHDKRCKVIKKCKSPAVWFLWFFLKWDRGTLFKIFSKEKKNFFFAVQRGKK